MEGNFVGKHLIADCIYKNSDKHSDINLYYKYLTELTDVLGMTLITAPVICEFPFTNEAITLAKKLKESGIESPILDSFQKEVQRKKYQESGISGFCIWAESHSSFHQWTESNFISFDVYSCKNFDNTLAINFIKETFNIKSGVVSTVLRYTDIPHIITNSLI